MTMDFLIMIDVLLLYIKALPAREGIRPAPVRPPITLSVGVPPHSIKQAVAAPIVHTRTYPLDATAQWHPRSRMALKIIHVQHHVERHDDQQGRANLVCELRCLAR